MTDPAEEGDELLDRMVLELTRIRFRLGVLVLFLIVLPIVGGIVALIAVNQP